LVAGYKKYGFYWPTAEDIEQLARDHQDFNLNDLVLDRIRYKADGCGFTMLQLLFNKGISSPIFLANEENKDDHTTTHIKFSN
jgi:hypothetical protein